LVKPSGKVIVVSNERTKVGDVAVNSKWLDDLAEGKLFTSEDTLKEYGHLFYQAPKVFVYSLEANVPEG
jgi:hypothetical protein